jgi:hypothetical protein
MNTHHSFALWYANFDGPQQELPVEGHGHEGDRDIWFGMSGPDAAAAAEAGAAAEGGDGGELKG